MKEPCCTIVAQLAIQTFLEQRITVHVHLEKFKAESFMNTNYSSGKGDSIFSWMLEVLINSSVMTHEWQRKTSQKPLLSGIALGTHSTPV